MSNKEARKIQPFDVRYDRKTGKSYMRNVENTEWIECVSEKPALNITVQQVEQLLCITVQLAIKLDDLKARYIPLHDSGNGEITELVERAHSIAESFGYNYNEADALAQRQVNAAIKGPTEEDDIEEARRKTTL